MDGEAPMTNTPNHRICRNETCANPAADGSLICTPCKAGQPTFSASEEDLQQLLHDPFGARPDVIPSENAEGFARMLREQYIALRRQNFTEDQALTLVSKVITSVIEKSIDDNKKDGNDE
jgi:hypothetical protein